MVGNIITGIFTLLGVVLGFSIYHHEKILPVLSKSLKKKPKVYGDPLVISTDEYDLEIRQNKEKERKKNKFVPNVKEFVKKLKK